MRGFLGVALISLFTIGSFPVLAQDGGGSGLVTGRLVSQDAHKPVSDVQLVLPRRKLLATTDAEGKFVFSRVPFGNYELLISSPSIQADTLKVSLQKAIVDLGDIVVVRTDNNQGPSSQQIPVISLEENDLSADDDGVRLANVSGLLGASRDPFVSAVAFVFGPYRFQARGYDRNRQEVMINGAPMNDVETGDAYWSQWGGLNDVFRSRSNTYGLQPAAYSFGDVNGSVYFDASAASQRKQTRVTYSATNRNYSNRLMLTYSSGLLKNGWAYSLSASRRWAKEGYIPGTFYDGYSYYAGLSKRFAGGKHELNLITFGAPTQRGKSSPVTQETYDLAGSNFYNPNWGYQNGEKRNARVANSYQPVAILNYRYAPSNNLRWNTSLSVQSGKNRNSSLDWYNAENPRPDYYRNLPSYLSLNELDPSTAQFYGQQQVDWNKLYNENYSNYDSIVNAGGIAGNTVRGKRSVYVVADDVDDVRKFNFNTRIEKVESEHITVQAGLQFMSQRAESYRQLTDLMGGDFYTNLNQFAVLQNVPDVAFDQYDLNAPNRAIREGDKYGYDYISRFSKGFIWAQMQATFNKFDFFLSGRGGFQNFSREGLYRNGLFPTESYGRSSQQHFGSYGLKGGVTYKLDGRNYFFLHAGLSQEPPSFDNTYISPRTRSLTVLDPSVEKISSIEGGYLMRTPKYNIRLVGYATDVKDATEIKRFYNDDPAFRSFVNYVIRGVNTRYTGLEAAVEVKLMPVLSVSAVAALGQAFYTSNPKSIGIYQDNDTVSVPTERKAYIQNYYLAVGPQSAYTLGFRYGPMKYWYANLNLNYFDRNYVDINPDRRTSEAVSGLVPGSEQYHRIVDQEKLPSSFTVDLSISKSFLLSKYSKALPRNTFLYFSLGVSNLLDSKDIRTGGFEQLRYDFASENPDKFPSKYFYGYGRNFFLNLSLKF
ncbi:MAG: TonB-dependent receptor [Bacteroidetes bacterium]|nr:TonB-dependent receptor [Bacteroidota bacterium]MBS1630798.1 TonB-dependent receptor [Bacteroidota bacterium]